MAIRVWNKPRTGLGSAGDTYVDYPDATSYHVGTSFELDLREIAGKLLVSYPPDHWHHVEMKPDTPDA